MTQTALAEECGRSPQYVNNIVRRGQRITQDFAQELSAAVDVNLNWLFTGKGTMLRGEATRQVPSEEMPADTDTRGVEAQMRHASEHLLKAAEQLGKCRHGEHGTNTTGEEDHKRG
jgi:transcriptional regulator with XRE-family HTH domain